jgi:hypothetical protein
MSKRLILGAVVAVVAVSGLLGGWLLRGGDGSTRAQGETVEMGIDPEVTGNTATTLGTLEDCVRVDVPSLAFDGVSDYAIDVYVRGDTQAPMGYDAYVTYDAARVHVASPDTNPLIKLPAASAFSDALPDADGEFVAGAVYMSGGPGTAGDGTLVRLGLDIGGSGLVTFDFSVALPATAYASAAGEHPITRKAAQLAINEDCPSGGDRAEPTPTPTQPPMATPILPMEIPGWDKFEESMKADSAKPRFTGELGDFIVNPDTSSGYPCSEPYKPGTNPEGSELYFTLPGAEIDTVGACQNTIISITAGVPDETGGAVVGRRYFVGPKLEVPFDAPEDRLNLVTVAGKPGLALLPIPDCIACVAEVAVIERFPTEMAPGIVAWAHTGDLDEAISLVERIMAGKE